MGVLTFLADFRTGGYFFAVIALIGLGLYLIFKGYVLYGIILLILGVLGLFTIKTFRKIRRKPAEYTEKNYRKKETGALIGSIIGGLVGIVYVFAKDINTARYTEGSWIVLIPLIIGGIIGHLIQKATKKNI